MPQNSHIAFELSVEIDKVHANYYAEDVKNTENTTLHWSMPFISAHPLPHGTHFK